MKTTIKYSVQLNAKPSLEQLQKGCWVVIINAERIPPHIGLLFNGKYCSLNIKGKELDIELPVLMRKIDMQAIKTVFVKLKSHPVFSVDFLHEHFKLELDNYIKVSAETTCFAPVRAFMQENYLLKFDELKYLYELFPVLYRESMVDKAFGLYLSQSETFVFEPYLAENIADKLNEIQQMKISDDQY